MVSRLRSLSLLWKVLLSTSVVITALLALTAWLVENHLVHSTSAMLEDEVGASFRAYKSLWEARAERLASVSLILSRSPAVRAAFGTGDQATIHDTAAELFDTAAPGHTLFFVTAADGRVLASLGNPGDSAPPRLPLDAASRRFPKQATGFLVGDGRMYQMVFTPVYVAAGQDSALLNVLVAGFEVDTQLANELKQSTNSDFLFLSQGRVIASTLSLPGNLPASPERQIRINAVDYAQFVTPLLDIAGAPAGELRILRSFEDAQQRINMLSVQILVIWLFAVLLGLALTYLLARRIVEPVKALDLAAAEIGKGNYEVQVPVSGSDELGRLARTFNSMCASIRHARDELIRHERIATVGRLSTSIIHDLRNPLAAIYGGAEMLVDADLSSSQVKRLAGSIYHSSRRVLEMLQELADATRGRNQRRSNCRSTVPPWSGSSRTLSATPSTPCPMAAAWPCGPKPMTTLP